MSVQIDRMSAAIGAIISGTELVTCGDTEFEQIRDALHEHQVIFVRDAPWHSGSESPASFQ